MNHGFERFVGVPCGHLDALITTLSSRDVYAPAVHEGSALALAAGYELAGTRTAVLLQNAGLGNIINPLASLLQPFEIPVLVVASLRGWPDPNSDEPEHAVMGPRTEKLLECFDVPYWVLTGRPSELESIVENVDHAYAQRRTAAILVPPRLLEPSRVESARKGRWGRHAALSILRHYLTDCVVLSTAGYISRDLFELADQPGAYYVQGAMGHVLSLGLGVAMSGTTARVVVIDGDGSCLMGMGAMATVSDLNPPNLIHVVLDNQAYESTGGQPTSSRTVDWAELATAVGYAAGYVCECDEQLKDAWHKADSASGPALIALKVGLDDSVVGPRATDYVKPLALTERFRDAVRAVG